MKVTPTLAAVVGKEVLSRPEITKAMYAYFKTHELYNPSDKREILCDAKLQEITGVDKFTAFGVQKYIKEHVLGFADAV